MKKPLARNDIGSTKLLYKERLFYSRGILTSAEYRNLMDLWTLKFSEYGKVNLHNQKVRIRQDPRFLKQLESDDDTPYYAINFVADAFNDLRKYCRSGAIVPTRMIPASSKFANLNPAGQNRWEPIRGMHEQHLRNVFDLFNRTYMQFYKHQKRVTNIDTFLEMVLKFSKDLGTTVPITKIGYIESIYSGVNYNGLMVEVAEEEHGDDTKKWQWIKDPGFNYWVRGCAMHGFWVDRNAPWRVIANLESKSMNRYMRKYNIFTINDFFNAYCVRVFMDEIRELKIYMYKLYNALLRIAPEFVEKKFLPNYKTTEVTRVRRTAVDEDAFYRRYNDRYWMRYWFYLRMNELGVDYTARHKKEILKTAYRIQIELDLSNALEYLTRVLHRAQGYKDVAEKSFIQRKRDRQIIVHS